MVAGVGVAAGVVQVSSGADSGAPRESRERSFSGVSGCLLTDARGLSGSPADAVWAGLQEASARTSATASYVPVLTNASSSEVVPYVNSLILSRCDLVVGVGPAQARAVASVAQVHPAVRFAVGAGHRLGSR